MKNELTKAFQDGQEVAKSYEIDYSKSEAIANCRREYTHTKTEDLENGCPLHRAIHSGCFECSYTDIIGYCVFPIAIDEEIEAGRARPLSHSHSWPERDAFYEAIRQKAAFKAVDKR